MIIRDRGGARILTAALGLGVLADVLFYGHALGVSVPLFVGSGLLALIVLGRWSDVLPARANLWLLGPLLACAGLIAWRANGLLTFLNGMAVLGLLGLLAGYYAAGRLDRLGLIGYPLALLLALAQVLLRPAPLLPASLDLSAVRGHGGRAVLPVLRGLLLALPVLLVLSVLLASADMVFGQLLGGLFASDVLAWVGAGGQQLALILGTAWLMAGGLVYALRRSAEDVQVEDPGAGRRWQPLGAIEAITVLISVDVLFAVFGWIQFTYLFGGQANITRYGYTYAEYARRGFFELVLVAVLTLGLILGLQTLTRRATRGGWWAFGLAATLLVAGVLMLVAAALRRMGLYEAAYGYTHLRLYVSLFLIWLGLLFGLFVVTLWTRPDRFALGAFVTGLGLLLTLNAVNPDATIARENLGRYFQTPDRPDRLDTNYLADLSDDAVPELVAALPRLQEPERTAVLALLKERRLALGDPSVQGWPAFHFARARAAALLAGLAGP